MLHRVLHGLLQLLLDLLEPADVVPRDLRNLDNCLAKSGRIGCTKCKTEVVHRDPKRVKHFSVDCVLIQVNHVHLLANLLHGCLGT